MKKDIRESRLATRDGIIIYFFALRITNDDMTKCDIRNKRYLIIISKIFSIIDQNYEQEARSKKQGARGMPRN